MKAVRLHRDINGFEALFVEEVPMPQPAAGEALVKVQAAGVTPTELAWSTNWIAQDGSSRQFPIPGHEFCGVVMEVGAGVRPELIGKEVYALTDFRSEGAQAEYTLAPQSVLAPKPVNLDFEKAAAVPLSALTAWQALFEHARLTASQSILVHGAAGGVGSLAIQLAHWTGAYVIGTASMRDLEFVRGLGAAETIPYHEAHFEQIVHDVDAVLDTVGGDTLERSWEVLKKGGILVAVADEPLPERASSHQVRAAYFVVHPDQTQLVKIGDLIEAGQIKAVLDKVYPLEQARQAYLHAQTGHPRGKVVLKIAD